MLRSFSATARRAPLPDAQLSLIRTNIAKSMIGRAVDMVKDAKTITHGTITEVFVEAGSPRLVVNGMEFDLRQILTVTPAAFN